MDYTKNSISKLAIFSLFLASVTALCVWAPKPFNSFFSPDQNPPCPQSNWAVQSLPKDELEEALSKASMADRTVIIAVVNKAYVEPHDNKSPAMFDIFLESFWLGEDTRPLLDHLLLVAVDQTSYERCKFRRLNCYKLETAGVDFTGEKLYMSEDFINMMWRRTRFLLDVLNRGYNFIFTLTPSWVNKFGLGSIIFSRIVELKMLEIGPREMTIAHLHKWVPCEDKDTDVMWLRNPFSKLSKIETEDIQMSTDVFNGNPWSKRNMINTGFYYIRSNKKTISLFRVWYAVRRKAAGMKEQDVLTSLVNRGIFKRLGLKVRFLDTLYFSGFCSDSGDVKAVTTVHANCCRSIHAKVADLRAVLGDWKGFKDSSSNDTSGFHWSRHNGCMHSWHESNNTLS
ncbi:unnamed protein product [Ilex paraguariensis]|uniref:Nucleotide-diphospho-sugar transferase domain-containing protein n=1 Tax=Ilex paraguariensis TaxID=185542 RepID=A0ABC8QLT4_9AQUA